MKLQASNLANKVLYSILTICL